MVLDKIYWDNVSMLRIYFNLGLIPTTRGAVASSSRYSPQDDKKSSIASESHQDEAGGRRDSFESEDMPIEPIENQTAYAKSNIIKGKITSLLSSNSPCPFSRANSEERVKPAGKRPTGSANPLPPVCSLPTKYQQRQTAAAQEGPTDAKSPKGELDEFSGRAGVSIFSKFSTMSFLQARDPNCAAMLDVRPAEGLGAGHCCVEGRDRDEPCFRRVPRVQSANGELGVSPVFTDWS